MRYKFTVIIEKDKNGYFALCPELQGCYTQGDTYREIMDNIRDVIKLHIKDRLEDKEDIPQLQLRTGSAGVECSLKLLEISA